MEINSTRSVSAAHERNEAREIWLMFVSKSGAIEALLTTWTCMVVVVIIVATSPISKMDTPIQIF